MERMRCRALVLASVDYGDSDRIVTFFTQEHGRLAAFAPGARKSRRRFAGVLEPFSFVEARLVERRGDTYRLEGAELLDGFGELRADLGRVARASYAAELMRELCREREPHPELFALFGKFLHALAREGAEAQELMRFELGALAAAGLMPRLDHCARCGLPSPPTPRFDPEHGGLLCVRCSGGFGMHISAQAAAALSALQSPAGPAGPVPAPTRLEARGVLSQFIAHHLGRRLRSLEFMREVGVEL